LELRVKRLEYHAAQLSDEKEDFEETLRNCAGRLKAIKDNILINSNDEDLQFKVNIMWNSLSETDEVFKSISPNKEQQDYAKNINKSKLSSLNKKLKKACHEYNRSHK